MKYFYFLLLLGVAVPSVLAGGICGDLDDLKTILCHTVKSYFAKILPPQVHVAFYLIDQLFDASKKSAWDQVKDNVEKYVDDQLTGAAWDDIENWYQSMVQRVHTCEIKKNKRLKASCFKNLQEDLSGFESQFQGDTRKETALFIRYYDIYTVTFFAVSDKLRDLTEDEDLKKSIDRDVIAKAQLFSAYLEKAITDAKYYACRHIKIRIEIKGSLPWSWPFAEYWPSDVESRDVPTSFANVGRRKRSEEESESNDDANEIVVGSAEKRRGCGFTKSKRVRAYVYDTKTESGLSEKSSVDECDLDYAKRLARSGVLSFWRRKTKECTDGLKTAFFLDLEQRLKYIKRLAAKNLN